LSKTRGSGEAPENRRRFRREKRGACSPGSTGTERTACREGRIPVRNWFGLREKSVGKTKEGEGGVVGGFIGAGGVHKGLGFEAWREIDGSG
jgi:hypothetical protein